MSKEEQITELKKFGFEVNPPAEVLPSRLIDKHTTALLKSIDGNIKDVFKNKPTNGIKDFNTQVGDDYFDALLDSADFCMTVMKFNRAYGLEYGVRAGPSNNPKITLQSLLKEMMELFGKRQISNKDYTSISLEMAKKDNSVFVRLKQHIDTILKIEKPAPKINELKHIIYVSHIYGLLNFLIVNYKESSENVFVPGIKSPKNRIFSPPPKLANKATTETNIEPFITKFNAKLSETNKYKQYINSLIISLIYINWFITLQIKKQDNGTNPNNVAKSANAVSSISSQFNEIKDLIIKTIKGPAILSGGAAAGTSVATTTPQESSFLGSLDPTARLGAASKYLRNTAKAGTNLFGVSNIIGFTNEPKPGSSQTIPVNMGKSNATIPSKIDGAFNAIAAELIAKVQKDEAAAAALAEAEAAKLAEAAAAKAAAEAELITAEAKETKTKETAEAAAAAVAAATPGTPQAAEAAAESEAAAAAAATAEAAAAAAAAALVTKTEELSELKKQNEKKQNEKTKIIETFQQFSTEIDWKTLYDKLKKSVNDTDLLEFLNIINNKNDKGIPPTKEDIEMIKPLYSKTEYQNINLSDVQIEEGEVAAASPASGTKLEQRKERQSALLRTAGRVPTKTLEVKGTPLNGTGQAGKSLIGTGQSTTLGGRRLKKKTNKRKNKRTKKNYKRKNTTKKYKYKNKSYRTKVIV
jgi:hypothetical protein